jgi:hypothetical protein
MEIDLYAKAVSLLEGVANSLHERDPKCLICFSTNEVQVVEQWLKEFVNETKGS